MGLGHFGCCCVASPCAEVWPFIQDTFPSPNSFSDDFSSADADEAGWPLVGIPFEYVGGVGIADPATYGNNFPLQRGNMLVETGPGVRHRLAVDMRMTSTLGTNDLILSFFTPFNSLKVVRRMTNTVTSYSLRVNDVPFPGSVINFGTGVNGVQHNVELIVISNTDSTYQVESVTVDTQTMGIVPSQNYTGNQCWTQVHIGAALSSQEVTLTAELDNLVFERL